MAWTAPSTLVGGTPILAGWANTDLRDNLLYLKGLMGPLEGTSILALSAGLRLGGTATLSLTGDVSDANPTGLATATFVNVTSDANPRTINSITAQAAGHLLILRNVSGSGAQTFALAHETGTTAANRILCPGATPVTISQFGGIALTYDGTTSRWRVVAHTN